MLTTSKLTLIKKDIKLALSMVESTHNIEFKLGNIIYSRYDFSLKLNAAIAEKGKMVNYAKTIWDKECHGFGLLKEDFGKQFITSNGDTYEITGIKARRGKYPILAFCKEDNKTYKFSATRIKTLIIKGKIHDHSN